MGFLEDDGWRERQAACTLSGCLNFSCASLREAACMLPMVMPKSPIDPDCPSRRASSSRFPARRSSCFSRIRRRATSRTAIEKLVEGVQRRPGLPDAARRHRLGQDLHHGQRDRAAGPAGDRVRAEQDAGRAALQRVPRVLPEERGRVLRQLLRLLPARGLRAAARPVHREGPLDQRAHRADAPVGDQERCSSGATW